MRFRASARRTLSIAAAAAVVLSAAALAPPLLAPGFPSGHDAAAHLTYVYLFDTALAQGQFPVRWVEWVRTGYSQPLFSFYQPGFYYAVQLVHLLVPSLLLATKLTVLGAWWAGSAFLYFYLRPLAGVWPAALAALLFMRAPYLILDVFVRVALPEFIALASAPAVLWSLDRTLRSGHVSWALALAAFSATMLVCHLPTAVMFLPVFLTYAGAMWLSGASRSPSVATASAAAVLALGLACFYVAPAVLELQFTKMRELTSAYFDYRRHFAEPWQWFSTSWGYGGSEPGTADQMSFQVGIVQWLVLGAGIAAAARLVVVRAATGLPVWLAYWLCVTLAALAMTSAASSWLWDAIPPLAYVQFPWRFLTVVSLAAALVGAFTLSSVRSHTFQAAAVLCVAAGLWLQTQGLLAPSQYLPPAWAYIDKPGWRYASDASKLAFVEPGYYPSTVARLPDGNVQRWQITAGRGIASARAVLDHLVVLDVDAHDDVELTIRSHGFPGWQVRVDGTPAPWRYQSETGFIVVGVPAGRHTVQAVFADTPVRAWANRISMLSAAAWGAGALVLAVGRVRRSSRRPASQSMGV